MSVIAEFSVLRELPYASAPYYLLVGFPSLGVCAFSRVQGRAGDSTDPVICQMRAEVNVTKSLKHGKFKVPRVGDFGA